MAGKDDWDNTNPDTTLFRDAASNPYYPLYFNALPVPALKASLPRPTESI
jgi:hypothetical protein